MRSRIAVTIHSPRVYHFLSMDIPVLVMHPLTSILYIITIINFVNTFVLGTSEIWWLQAITMIILCVFQRMHVCCPDQLLINAVLLMAHQPNQTWVHPTGTGLLSPYSARREYRTIDFCILEHMDVGHTISQELCMHACTISKIICIYVINETLAH